MNSCTQCFGFAMMLVSDIFLFRCSFVFLQPPKCKKPGGFVLTVPKRQIFGGA
jgi:hypothetical protein